MPLIKHSKGAVTDPARNVGHRVHSQKEEPNKMRKLAWHHISEQLHYSLLTNLGAKVSAKASLHASRPLLLFIDFERTHDTSLSTFLFRLALGSWPCQHDYLPVSIFLGRA